MTYYTVVAIVRVAADNERDAFQRVHRTIDHSRQAEVVFVDACVVPPDPKVPDDYTH